MSTRKLMGTGPGGVLEEVYDHRYVRIIAQRTRLKRKQAYGRRRWVVFQTLLLVLLLLQPGAQAQAGDRWAAQLPAVREGSAILVQADALVRQLGLVASDDGRLLTLRGQQGIFTLFADSPDFIWRPAHAGEAQEENLSAAVRRHEGDWWLPVDLFSYLGLWYEEGVVEGPDDLRLELVFPPSALPDPRGGELVDLGAGVPGVRLYAAGPGGPTDLSLLLADAGLLGLAMPQHQERFDELIALTGSDKPLLLFLTSVSPATWDTSIEFEQGDVLVEARFPFRLRLLEGGAAEVGPSSPVVGVVLLPAGFNLRAPIAVHWAGVSATVTFRR